MSLTSAMTIATSGMRAAQTGIRTVSDNIANVNTAGYVRKVVDQSATVISGTGAGVTVDGIRRTADMYLQKAMMNASAQVGQTGAVAEFLDRAQALFGDPSEASSFFNQLDPIFKAFATASENPTSGLRLSEATLQVKSFFDNAGQIGAELRGLVDQVGLRIGSAVDQANGLLDDINALNTEISRALISGRDASGAENVQSQLIDQLSKIVQLRISKGPTGGVTLAVADGTLLTGENRGRFEFASSGGAPGVVRLKFEFGAPVTLGDGLGGGELKGLIEMRDRVLPSISEQLGEFTARAADALNKAHNAASTAPAPTALSGRAIHAPLEDAVEGFTGRTAVAITDANGVVQRRVDIDFTARTFRIDGAATTSSWTPGGFQGALDAALSPLADVDFDTAAGGVLSITGSATARISVVDDPAAPSNRAGRGFSHYFGLNDLVASSTPVFYDNGLTPTDPHGFAAGGEIRFRFNDGSGARFDDVNITIPAGGTYADLLAVLNGPGGVGKVGTFSLENGNLRFTSKTLPDVALTVVRDTTSHTYGGKAMGELHGLGAQRGLRAETFSLRPELAGDASRLSLAQFDFTAAVGGRALARGDGRGAFGISQAGEVQLGFDRAGEANAIRTTLSNYGAQMGGAVGRRASIAEERHASAGLLLNEATARRSSVEGVNLDEELVQLTVYQQAYSASARLITAAKEMYDVLLSL
jgi:flagellar hook-associated protein 1 FlgK